MDRNRVTSFNNWFRLGSNREDSDLKSFKLHQHIPAPSKNAHGNFALETDQESYDRIAQLIHSDSSPVGIDARKTHVLIIQMLQDIQQRMTVLEDKVSTLSESK